MKICLVGKFPPIEGGVSACTYWLARGLASRGHEVHVVTNADEVENRYRIQLTADDAPWMQPDFKGAGRVRVHAAQAFSRRAMGHIPMANPFVSKLAAVATDVVRQHDCDVILAYYYEPYAVAGWMASRWTGCPVVVKHAGSDLDRLYRVPDLSTTYREILRSAEAIVTQPRLHMRFFGMGIDPARIERDIAYTLPKEHFTPNGTALDLARMALPSNAVANASSGQMEESAPVIGIYGKIGVTKGTFDLIAALGRLARKGFRFRLAALIGATQGHDIEAALREADILDRTLILPFLPNWRVPEFLRACTAVCVLERDFPVAIHGPVIPREILACGGCLVMSREIASKQRYRNELSHGANVLIVEDPKDHDELTQILERVIADPPHARAIGAKAAELSIAVEGADVYAEDWEALLLRRSRCAPPPVVATQGFEWVIPDLAAFLRRQTPEAFDEFTDNENEPSFGRAIRFLAFAAERLKSSSGASNAVIIDILDFARERLEASYYALGDHRSTFAVVDSLHGEQVSLESSGDLRPVHGTTMRIRTFDHDVSSLSLLDSVGGYAATGDSADLETLPAGPVTVLFHRSPNLIPCELRIDEATANLVRRCDGTVSLHELIAAMCLEFGIDQAELQSQIGTKICAALDHLYRSGVVVFGEWRNEWEWTGGDRSTMS